MRVRLKGKMRHRGTFAYFRTAHPKDWNALREGKEADINLEEWAKLWKSEFQKSIDGNVKAHFFLYNPGLGEVTESKKLMEKSHE